jgi:hypothetical protein
VIRKIEPQSQYRQIVPDILSGKYLIQKRNGRVAQVVKCLPSKHETLNSNPTPPKLNKI